MSKIIENQKDLFNLFTDKTDFMRPALEYPFYDRNNVCATDAKSVIYTEKENVDFEITSNLTLDIHGVTPQENCDIPIVISNDVMESLRMEDEMIEDEVGESTECEACYGNGEVNYEFYHKGETYYHVLECPVCEGLGVVELEKLVPSGNKVYSEYDVFKIGDACFSAKNISKLFQVHKFTNKPIRLLSQTKANKAILCKVDVYYIILMPMYLYEDRLNQYNVIDINPI